MTFYSLSLKDIIVATVIGLCIAGVFTYATAPRMVEVPMQVITPVPTPPPVVIGSGAGAGNPSNVGSPFDTQYCTDLTGTVNTALWAFGVFAVVVLILMLFNSNFAGATIQVIIMLLVLGVLITILPSVTNAVCESVVVIP